jgi:hypothetical protein
VGTSKDQCLDRSAKLWIIAEPAGACEGNNTRVRVHWRECARGQDTEARGNASDDEVRTYTSGIKTVLALEIMDLDCSAP